MIGIGTLVKLGIKVVSKLLPGKSGQAIQGLVTDAILNDEEVLVELEKDREFYLKAFRPDLLPQWAVAIKNLWRPFVAVIFSLYNLVFYTVQGTMPDKYFLTVSTGIIFAVVLGRTAEKIRKKLV